MDHSCKTYIDIQLNYLNCALISRFICNFRKTLQQFENPNFQNSAISMNTVESVNNSRKLCVFNTFGRSSCCRNAFNWSRSSLKMPSALSNPVRKSNRSKPNPGTALAATARTNAAKVSMELTARIFWSSRMHRTHWLNRKFRRGCKKFQNFTFRMQCIKLQKNIAKFYFHATKRMPIQIGYHFFQKSGIWLKIAMI